jgi:hypothetical protein
VGVRVRVSVEKRTHFDDITKHAPRSRSLTASSLAFEILVPVVKILGRDRTVLKSWMRAELEQREELHHRFRTAMKKEVKL